MVDDESWVHCLYEMPIEWVVPPCPEQVEAYRRILEEEGDDLSF